MKNLYWFVVIVALLSTSCKKDNEVVLEVKIGKNYVQTEIDGDLREYYLHVPNGYSDHAPLPVVIMLHGASGNGEITYKNSGWKELGETEKFLSVFPTAWSYCWIKRSGIIKDTTRWNSLPGMFEFCDDEKPRDDIKFLRSMINEIIDRFEVDESRIYMTGFSSGGQMSYRAAIEMSEVLAAVVQSGGTHQIGTDLRPARNLPITFELGNEDAAWFENGIYPPVQYLDTLLSEHWLFQKIVGAHTNTFAFEETYKISGSENVAHLATFQGIPDKERTFRFLFIEGLDHSYPNGTNHTFYGARFHWDWMKKHERH